jgi:gluconolactonase
MFNQLEIVASEIFASLPPEFRKMRRSDWADANQRGRALDCFLEGPCFDAAGNLYVVDIPFGRIFRVSPAGTFALVTEYDGEPNGLKVHPDGRLLVADYKRGLLAVDPATGAVEPLIERRASERFKGPNDLFLASNGDVYFTDQGQTGLHDPTGRVYRLAASGRLDLVLDGIPSPNGLVMDAEETVLFIAVTRGNCIWRAPRLLDGTVSKVGLFIQLSGGVGPDGLAIDAEGGLAVAHAGLGIVWHFDRLGRPLHEIRSATGLMTTNLAYGGSERTALYITESATGTILKAVVPAGRTPA